jgi:hypothetical protein
MVILIPADESTGGTPGKFGDVDLPGAQGLDWQTGSTENRQANVCNVRQLWLNITVCHESGFNDKNHWPCRLALATAAGHTYKYGEVLSNY